jgi:hypothetical protein
MFEKLIPKLSSDFCLPIPGPLYRSSDCRFEIHTGPFRLSRFFPVIADALWHQHDYEQRKSWFRGGRGVV